MTKPLISASKDLEKLTKKTTKFAKFTIYKEDQFDYDHNYPDSHIWEDRHWGSDEDEGWDY